MPQVLHGRFDLRPHATGRELSLAVPALHFIACDPLQLPLRRLLVLKIDSVGIGADDEEIGVQVRSEQRGSPVLVDDRLGASHAIPMLDHRNTASADGDNDHAEVEDLPNDVTFEDLDRSRGGDDPTVAAR